jgi:chromosomal replication initiator protein
VRNEWQSVLDEIKRNVSNMVFETFFTDIKASNTNGTITIAARNVFIKDNLRLKYHNTITDALKTTGITYEKLEFTEIKHERKTIHRSIEVLPENTKPPIKAETHTVTSNRLIARDNGLNPKFRFHNYVIGSNNDLAVSAARAIVDKPGTRYNPYFIYGGPGIGKTHLIQAIGNELAEKHKNLKILYVTTEQFYHDFVEAMRKKLDGFTDKYRRVDVLIIDDFQAIIGKEKSQEEFFNTFNHLHQKNKQIIISCDRLPTQIATVDIRLSSRLMMGMPIDIQMPDFETRCAILKSKAEVLGVELENSAVEYLAENIKTNIRDLEGNLNKLLALSELRGVSPGTIIDDGYLEEVAHTKHSRLTPKQVIDRVAKYYDLTAKDLLGASRIKNIKCARQVAMYLLNEELDISTVRVGTELNKDHSTIMHGVKKIKQDLKLDFHLREQIADLREKIYAA